MFDSASALFLAILTVPASTQPAFRADCWVGALPVGEMVSGWPR
jgi:hypothetical protein